VRLAAAAPRSGAEFSAAKKADPAFAGFCLDELRKTLTDRGAAVVDDDNLPGGSMRKIPGETGSNFEKFPRSAAVRTF
jgi:hypothetical protein